MQQPDIVSPQEAHEVEERQRPRSAVIFETIRREGEDELERASVPMFWSALAAGLSMSFSMITMGVIAAHLPDAPWRKLVSGFGYTIGFLIVILGRQQLFTENTLTPLLPWFADMKAWRLRAAMRVWAVILGANLVGAAIAAFFIAHTGAFEPVTYKAFGDMAQEAVGRPTGVVFAKAVFAGWLIALMVWLLPLAEQLTPLIIMIITWIIAASSLEHIIAGSVETIYGALTGAITWGDVAHFIVPTFLGNTIGGVAFVAAIASAEIGSERSRQRPLRQ